MIPLMSLRRRFCFPSVLTPFKTPDALVPLSVLDNDAPPVLAVRDILSDLNGRAAVDAQPFHRL